MKLEARGLGLQIGDRWLVRDCSLEVEPGAVTVIVGPNGSGKTTLMRTLLGLREASEGEVLLAGRPLSEHGLRERARACAWLPQRTDLPWSLPISELVMLGRAPHLGALGGPSKADREAVDEALERVGLAELRTRDVRTLSGGELQRAHLARLLATQAPILVLDEPTAALDIGHALGLLELTRTLAAAGHTLLLSIHELELARRHGDRALLLHGDDQGGHTLGPVDAVLTPDALSQVFAVDASLVEGQLRFDRSE